MTEDPAHVAAAIAHLLAEDTEVAELGIKAICDSAPSGTTIVLRGRVSSPVRRDRIADRVASAFPGLAIRNDIEIAGTAPPDIAEEA